MQLLNRDDMATFLRTRRARVRPADVGLPTAGSRRTPGLRRQEVAQLAGISVDYYIRLEQARGPHPSRQVLAALARALMLTADEREYLFRMAGESPPPAAAPVREVSQGIRALLDGLTQMPAYVVDARYDILAWNQLATHFIGDLSGFAESERNMIRWTFARPGMAQLPWSESSTELFARSMVADLRASYARYPADRGIAGLVTEMLGTSPAFAQMWDAHEVQARRPLLKQIVHPDAGPMEFECQLLHVSDTGQRLIVYCAEPGSATEAAFRKLAGIEVGTT
ncbi:MAG: helix-turn-helix domain-containing protein [Actinobacteria bacterium]|nr:helix-turn-helix domain-containing protein [Actinomycetota bacterium]